MGTLQADFEAYITMLTGRPASLAEVDIRARTEMFNKLVQAIGSYLPSLNDLRAEVAAVEKEVQRLKSKVTPEALFKTCEEERSRAQQRMESRK